MPATATVAGSVTLEGRELLGAPAAVLDEVRGGRVAMIFQDPASALNPVHRIGRQVAEAVRLHRGLSAAAARAEALRLLDEVGIPGARARMDAYPHEMSGGQNQRVMIAAALAGRPELLIADEPTTALDVTIQAQILDLLQRLRADLGMALVLISHDLGVVADMCDRVCVMYAGRIVEEADAASLFARPAHPYATGLLGALPAAGRPPPPPAGHPGPRAGALGDAARLCLCPALRPPHRAMRRRRPRLADRGAQPPRRLHPRMSLLTLDGVSRTYAMRRGWLGRPAAVHAMEAVSLAVEPGPHAGRGGGIRLRQIHHRAAGAGAGSAGSRQRALRRRRHAAARTAPPGAGCAPACNWCRRTRSAHWTGGSASRRQIAEPLAIHGLGSAADRAARLARLLDDVGLRPDQAARHPHALSGGQRQRAVLARALATAPDLLVCDEPVSALDVSIQAQIVNLLVDLQAERRIAMLFISHDLRVVRQVSHEVAVMYLGRVIERGDPDAVFAEPAHPYARALVSAIPGNVRGAKRTVLQGDPPNPADRPPGCAFHPRCPAVVARCRAEVPVLKPRPGDGRPVACHVAQAEAERGIRRLGAGRVPAIHAP